MAKMEISSQDVIDAVNDEHQLAPTGYQDFKNKETYVRVHSEFRNAEECNNLFIPSRPSAHLVKVKIKDVAQLC